MGPGGTAQHLTIEDTEGTEGTRARKSTAGGERLNAGLSRPRPRETTFERRGLRVGCSQS
jgi:hypothetical protein